MTVRFGRKKTRQNVIVISKYALEEFVICCINELSKICVLRRTQNTDLLSRFQIYRISPNRSLRLLFVQMIWTPGLY